MTESNQFRTVLRGYDPAQVDHTIAQLAAATEAARQEAAQHAVAVSKLESSHAELRGALEARDGQLAALTREYEQAQRKAAAPTFADLGERIGHILTLADEEATQIRAAASEHADGLRLGAEQASVAAKTDADRYAEDVRTRADAEAARILEDAKRRADEIVGNADREASARREEAEAVYEHQRAKSAAAAADFETTLAQRRDKAAADFAAQMGQQEQTLRQVQERASTLSAEAEKAHAKSRTDAAALLEQARSEASALVASAREQAERVKRDSDRELAAATSRRDAITAQLGNVRQMLATLGGASMMTPLLDEHGVTEEPGVVAQAAAPTEVEMVAEQVAEPAAETTPETVNAEADPVVVADEAPLVDELASGTEELVVPDLADEVLGRRQPAAGRRR